MAYEFYMFVEGTKQGALKGESLKDKWKDKCTGISFSHEVKSPRDAATGLPSGKRQHSPLCIVKEWGASSPQLMQALCTNEILKKVTFEFIHTTAEGVEEVYFVITLTNATIARVVRTTGGANSEGSAKVTTQWDTMELESIEFTYQKIEWEHKPASTMAGDDWVAA